MVQLQISNSLMYKKDYFDADIIIYVCYFNGLFHSVPICRAKELPASTTVSIPGTPGPREPRRVSSFVLGVEGSGEDNGMLVSPPNR